MTHYKAVLFDAGGTLWYEPKSPEGVWHEILADLGFDVPGELIEAAFERELKLLRPQVLAFNSSGRPNEPSDIESMWAASEKRVVEDLGLIVDLNRLRRVSNERFTANDDLYPETVGVVKKLRTMGMQMAIVSDGVNQERTAGRLGIDGYFHRIVGSVHVGFTKPSPEIFHLALSALRIEPEKAIMVGDNWEADILGGRGIGMRSVHIIRGNEDPVGPDTIKELWNVIDILTQKM